MPKTKSRIVEVLDVGPNQPANSAEAGMAVADLERLKADPAWQKIANFYLEKVELIENSLYKNPGSRTKEEYDLMIVRRNMSFQFANIMDILIKGIKLKETVNKEVKLHPYDLPKAKDDIGTDELSQSIMP